MKKILLITFLLISTFFYNCKEEEVLERTYQVNATDEYNLEEYVHNNDNIGFQNNNSQYYSQYYGVIKGIESSFPCAIVYFSSCDFGSYHFHPPERLYVGGYMVGYCSGTSYVNVNITRCGRLYNEQQIQGLEEYFDSLEDSLPWDIDIELTGSLYDDNDDNDDESYSPPNFSNPDKVPPSCKSFDFTTIPGGNWQYSYVEGIRFLIIDRNGFQKIIIFNNPIEFGAPLVDRYGNEFSKGSIAEISALALQEAMDNTKDYLRINRFSSSGDVERYFESQIKRLYPIYTDGGRVNFSPTKIKTSVTGYRTTGISLGGVNFLTDSCD